LIYLYYTTISEKNHASVMSNHLTRFGVEYQNKINKYRRWQDAQLSLLGKVLLFEGSRDLFGQPYDDTHLTVTKYNKPFFEKASFKFNISHSGEIVVCAFCEQTEIGVDIETISDIKIEDFKSQMTENEWNRIILSGNRYDAFFDYWTQKEAVIKAHGFGLSLPLQSFEIVNNATFIQQEPFYLKEINIAKNYKCYVAANTPIGKVLVKERNYG
jgi:4'-phosphopantetheinyl transferase